MCCDNALGYSMFLNHKRQKFCLIIKSENIEEKKTDILKLYIFYENHIKFFFKNCLN